MSRPWAEVFKQTTLNYQTDVPCAALSTFRIGGSCPVLIEPQCEGELLQTMRICRIAAIAFWVIGRGSNLLFSDEPLPGVLIRTTALDAVRRTRDGIEVQAGCTLSRLAHFAAREGLAGLCFAAGIPGTVGGALVMNAGAYGGEIGDLVQSATVYDAQSNAIEVLPHEALRFSYRSSALQDGAHIVLSAKLCLTQTAPQNQLFDEMRALAQKRRATQPLQYPSAGSVFRRPATGEPMGKIIEELGMKGLRCGNAAVSQHHAGFIVNLGGATARDVRALIERIQKNVERERGFRPIPEIRFIP